MLLLLEEVSSLWKYQPVEHKIAISWAYDTKYNTFIALNFQILSIQTQHRNNKNSHRVTLFLCERASISCMEGKKTVIKKKFFSSSFFSFVLGKKQ